MKRKPLPIGISDYVRAQSDYYYVDKTLLIKEFLDQKPLVSLISKMLKNEEIALKVPARPDPVVKSNWV